MKVSIIGAGYVGLVSGVCLSEKGHRVICVEKDPQKVKEINSGISPIYEEGLDDILAKNINKNFVATTALYPSILDSEITLIAVGTPFDGRQIDLSQVKEVSAQIGKALREKGGYHAVIVKSTVVPGTTDEVVLPALQEVSGKKPGFDFGVGMNPEFLTEGQAVEDFMNPDRIVLGANDEKDMMILEELYKGFKDTPKIKTNNKTAEMIKYVSNAMLATQISFANEIANLCSALGGVDIVDVMKGVHLSNYLCPRGSDGNRVQAPLSAFIQAGCGFGGSCLPKDVQALIAHGQKYGEPMTLLKAVIGVNHKQPHQILKILKKHFGTISGLSVTILGLSFKPNTDDMRESPAIPIIQLLLKEGAKIIVHDPVSIPRAKEIFRNGEVEFQIDLKKAVEKGQVIVLVTKWDQYQGLPQLLDLVADKPLVVDGRRIFDKKTIFRYDGIGL
jgi:UDPglucose 6-dehydrogenase